MPIYRVRTVRAWTLLSVPQDVFASASYRIRRSSPLALQEEMPIVTVRACILAWHVSHGQFASCSLHSK